MIGRITPYTLSRAFLARKQLCRKASRDHVRQVEYCGGSQTLKQIAQKGYGISVFRDIQNVAQS